MRLSGRIARETLGDADQGRARPGHLASTGLRSDGKPGRERRDEHRSHSGGERDEVQQPARLLTCKQPDVVWLHAKQPVDDWRNSLGEAIAP